MAVEIDELPDRWILPLEGSEVTAVDWDDDAVRFRLDTPGEITVGLEAVVTRGPLTAPGASPRTLGELGQDEIGGCIGSQVVSVVGFKNGALRVVLDNGWHLNVPSTGPFVPASVTAGESVTWSRDPVEEPPPAAP
jgi:hypothetical protein